ncbi:MULTISPECIES: TetR/AcrR family transcriptional regulator [Novosphingobium]|uniref:Transcriptional regulator, TetR family n=1 Tax=Novosphingobium mathurense TaxID=428990 RepID=A0A1U6HWE4_9SPHN|nr:MULTISPECIES: TetR/AcrR family transcriptional regulator [Novosphingobium]CDO37897.1 Transcriptional regulator, TetR family [Novosphingobium sp. KN65.2]SLK00088.1 transcriptional regulator, TetR family [Novosphingobium mathurense]
MPRKAKTKDAKATLSVDTVSKTPLQGRSKASLERMLVAAEKLMLERGSEEFTLQDVSHSGNVSIGSIYLRFESKENLVRAVIGNHLAKMAADEDAMIARVRSKATSLATLVPQYVEAFAELLKKHAPLLRLSMQRASFDPLVSEPGRASANRAAALGIESMLEYRDQFGGNECEKKANAAYQIIFATLARQLSLGSTGEAVHPQDWAELKIELGRMCLAYLSADL